MAEWETHDSNTTDSNGLIEFRGFHGTYEITLTPSGGNPEVHTIELLNAPGTAQFTLKIGSGVPPDTNAPVLDPLTWLSSPQAVSADVVSMTAAEANDISGVLYYFNNVTYPNHDSGWQENTFYADSGLMPNTEYTYCFKVRDKSTQRNETPFSNPTTVLTTGSGGNILTNAGFEAATAMGWSTWSCDLTAVTDHARSGYYSGLTEIRGQSWQGPVRDITNKVVDGQTYQCSVWVRLENSASQPVSMNIKQVDDGGTHYYNIATGTAYNDQWICLASPLILEVDGTLQNLSIYISGPAAGVNFYIDDMLVKADPVNCLDVQKFGFRLASDISGDCYVNYTDLDVLTDYWLDENCTGPDNCHGADFEPADGEVDLYDFSDFAKQWLMCNDPTDSGCSPNW